MRPTLRSRFSILSLLVSCVLGASASAHAQETATRVDASLSPTSMRVGSELVEVGCPITGAVRASGQLVVTCSGARVRILARGAAGYVVVEERHASADIAQLFVVDGVAWGLVQGTPQRIDAMEVVPGAAPSGVVAAPAATTAAPAAPAVPSAPAPPTTAPWAQAERSTAATRRSPAAAWGQVGTAPAAAPAEEPDVVLEGVTVQRMRGPHAVLPAGLQLHRGDHVELVPASGRRHAPVIGVVGDVTDDETVVDVGFGEPVLTGDGARVTRRATTARAFDPPEHRRTISIAGNVGVLIDAAGIGTIDQLELTWRTDLPFTLRARVQPFGAIFIGHTTDVPENGGAIVAGGTVDAILDTHYFAIGVGLGFGGYTTRFITRPTAPESTDQLMGFAALSTIRIGPAEGLHLEVTSGILAVIDEFRFGGVDARARFPVVPQFELELRGGYWPTGLGVGQVGCRMAVEGNGGAGTVFVTPFIGAAGLNTGNHGFRAGPVIGLGIEGVVGQ